MRRRVETPSSTLTRGPAHSPGRRCDSPVRMQFTTSGKSALMSLPTVMAAITFLTASFMVSRSEAANSARSSDTSPAIPELAERWSRWISISQPGPSSLSDGFVASPTFLGGRKILGVLAHALHSLAGGLVRVLPPFGELAERGHERRLKNRHLARCTSTQQAPAYQPRRIVAKNASPTHEKHAIVKLRMRLPP